MSVDTVIAELNEIVRPDGAVLHVLDLSPTSLHLALDLSNSSCPECVVPKQLMLDILQTQLAKLDPDIRTVQLDDPRETGEETT